MKKLRELEEEEKALKEELKQYEDVKGCIVRKVVIKGEKTYEYYCLVWKEGGKQYWKSLGKNYPKDLAEKLKKRKELQQKLKKIRERKERIKKMIITLLKESV